MTGVTYSAIEHWATYLLVLDTFSYEIIPVLLLRHTILCLWGFVLHGSAQFQVIVGWRWWLVCLQATCLAGA